MVGASSSTGLSSPSHPTLLHHHATFQHPTQTRCIEPHLRVAIDSEVDGACRFPRTVAQTKALDEMLSQSGEKAHPLPTLLHLPFFFPGLLSSVTHIYIPHKGSIRVIGSGVITTAAAWLSQQPQFST